MRRTPTRWEFPAAYLVSEELRLTFGESFSGPKTLAIQAAQLWGGGDHLGKGNRIPEALGVLDRGTHQQV